MLLDIFVKIIEYINIFLLFYISVASNVVHSLVQL